MKKLATLCLALCACGVGAASEYSNAAPNYQTLALDMESNDTGSQSGAALTGDSCHPHLFQRTREVVSNLNLHIYAVVHRLELAIDEHPDAASGTTRTWKRKINGFAVQASLDETSTGNFTFTAGVAAAGSSDYTQFLTGTLVAGTAPHEGSGTLTMDLTALGTVDKSVLAQGQFTVDYNINGSSKVETITFTNYQPPNGFNAEDTAIRPPRSGTYTFARTTGVGGSLKFNEQVDLLCPSNPSQLAANVNTVAVWTHDPSTGDLVGRADSQATGGQLATGNTWEGVTCFDINKDSDGTGVSAETYWMMKDEDSTGATVQLNQVAVEADSTTATPVILPAACSSLLGTLPDPTDSNSDYAFAAIDFSDSSVVAYPGEPDGGV